MFSKGDLVIVKRVPLNFGNLKVIDEQEIKSQIGTILYRNGIGLLKVNFPRAFRYNSIGIYETFVWDFTDDDLELAFTL